MSRPAALLLAGALLALARPAFPAEPFPLTEVLLVVDAATVHVRWGGRREVVRYLGIAVPQVHHPARGAEPFAAEAAEAHFTLVGGRAVRLEFEGEPGRDADGALLAYAFLEDGTFLNARLVEAGWAWVVRDPGARRYRDLLEGKEAEARAARRGIWR